MMGDKLPRMDKIIQALNRGRIEAGFEFKSNDGGAVMARPYQESEARKMAKGKRGKKRKLDWDALAEMGRYELNNLIDKQNLSLKGFKSMGNEELRWRVADELGIVIEDEKIRADSLNKMDRYELMDLITNLDLDVEAPRSMDDDELRAAIAEELGIEFEAVEAEENYEPPAYGDKLDAETAAGKLNALWDELGSNFLMTKKQLAKFCGRDYKGAFKSELGDKLDDYRILISATEKGFAVIYLDDTENLAEVDKAMMKQVFA